MLQSTSSLLYKLCYVSLMIAWFRWDFTWWTETMLRIALITVSLKYKNSNSWQSHYYTMEMLSLFKILIHKPFTQNPWTWARHILFISIGFQCKHFCLASLLVKLVCLFFFFCKPCTSLKRKLKCHICFVRSLCWSCQLIQPIQIYTLGQL